MPVRRGSQIEPGPVANNNLIDRVRTPPPRGPESTPVPAAPLEAAMSQLAMDSAARRASSLPPPPTQVDAAGRLAPEPLSIEGPRSPTEILPAAAPVRIAPLPPAPFDAAVKVLSPARAEVPRNFGELLTLSLSLRPK